MSRSKNETAMPHQRGRKSIKRSKRLSSKKVRNLPFDSGYETLKKVRLDIVLDKDTPNHPVRKPKKY